jgi:threonine/homoserine/homoserine lactone efflux protein
MQPTFLARGLIIGISIAAPVGPIGILCIRRSLRDGMWAGFIAGLGAATADAAYGAVAGFGLTTISGLLLRHRLLIGLIGGAFLCYLGAKAILSRPVDEPRPAKDRGAAFAYASTLLLTLANPATILSFAAVFAAFGLGRAIDYPAAGSLVLGVFLGSALWWLFLSGGVNLVRNRVNSSWMRAANRVSGSLLIGFGLITLWRA